MSRERKTAPVAIFIYKRPEHTERLIQSLLANPECEASPVTVYCDAARNTAELKDVSLARDIAKRLLPNATIVERDKNIGLANSIIAGVSEQCDKYGRVIVLEDDLIISPVALRYFNDALDFYEVEDRVMHISAYMYPIKAHLPDTFFYREPSCWGWATWANSWKHFVHDSNTIIDYIERNNRVRDFGMSFTFRNWQLLKSQCEGKIDSWFIRWYGSLFMNNGLALHPRESLVKNEGFDGSGIHSGISAMYDVEINNHVPAFSSEIEESREVVKAMYKYRDVYKPHTLRGRVWHFLRRVSYRFYIPV